MQNLWPELNNEQSPPDAGGQVQEPLKRRRLTERTLLSSLRDWLLHDYVVPYCRTLSNSRIYRRCYWIDALGSIETRAHARMEAPSTLDSHEQHSHTALPDHPAKRHKKEAAPVIPTNLQTIISLADVLTQGSRPIALHGIVLEAGSSKRKEIRSAAGEPGGDNHVANPAKAASLLPKESGIVRASWLELAPALLDLTGQSPAIFLLNPFGHTLFSYDDLAPLYQRTAPTELGLLISHKQVMAHLTVAKDVTSLTATHLAPGSSPIYRGSATTLTALLRSDRWKALPTDDVGTLSGASGARFNSIASAGGVGPTIDGVIDLLIASMQRHFLSVQRIGLPVQMGPALVETAPYTLIFATRRQDSLASMNDAVCVYRRRLYEQSRRGVLAEAWFAAQQQERLAEDMQQLYQRMLQHGRAQRLRRWPDLRQQLLNADFGHYTLHEYDEVMQQMLARGDVRCEWRSPPIYREEFLYRGSGGENEERRIPGSEDMLLWSVRA